MEQNNTTKQQFNNLDVMKFICTILVVILHIYPFPIKTPQLSIVYFYLQNYVCRVAVPFFFITSGFLLFRKIDLNNIDTTIIKKYCFKIFRLLGIWTFLLFNEGFYHLWYMGALILSIVIITILLKKGIRFRYILLISIITYLIGLFGDAYYGYLLPLKANIVLGNVIRAYDIIFHNTRNGIFFGLLFVSMGIVFSKKQFSIKPVFTILGLTISVIAMFFEVYLLVNNSTPKDYNMFLTLPIVMFFLYQLTLSIKLKNKPIYSKIRIIGMLVFYIHLLTYFFVRLAEKALKNIIILTPYRFILTLSLSIIIAIIIERLSKTERFRWLKYLYS